MTTSTDPACQAPLLHGLEWHLDDVVVRSDGHDNSARLQPFVCRELVPNSLECRGKGHRLFPWDCADGHTDFD